VAVDEVGGPTILATLTVIAALLPMAFVSGLMGPYMSPIPINSSLGMALVAGHRVHRDALARAQADEAGAHAAGHGRRCGRGGRARARQRLFTWLLLPLLHSARKRWLLLAWHPSPR
jgi:hypothetical protein